MVEIKTQSDSMSDCLVIVSDGLTKYEAKCAEQSFTHSCSFHWNVISAWKHGDFVHDLPEREQMSSVYL